VQPVHERPAVVAERQRFSHIVVDRVNITQHSMRRTVDVVFLATIEGTIQKYVLLSNASNGASPCLVEEICLTPDSHPQPVKVLKLLHGSLIVGMSNRLHKVPVHRCGSHNTRSKCLGLHDPYCNWDLALEKCVANGHPQMTSTCSDTDFPVDGKWSEWSPWESCHANEMSSEQCQCRTRSCDNPRPSTGGAPCLGPRIQVVNCTVHGQWSEWSAWSSCSVTDSGDWSNVQTRRRSCTSPAPRNSGRPCVGDVIDSRECPAPEATKQPPKVQPVDEDRRWSSWSEWTQCSVKCGNGQQSRQRFGINGQDDRVEKAHEARVCYAGKCPVRRKTSSWSTWHRFNTTDDGSYIEERQRCVCRARVHDDSLLRAPIMRAELRRCSPDGADCIRYLTSPPTTTIWPPAPVTTPSSCPKCIGESKSEHDRENSIFDKDVLSDGTYSPMSTSKTSVDRGRHSTNYSAVFCDCRDLGPLRVCRRCSAGDYTRYILHRVRRSTSVDLYNDP
jgi:chondroitin sulfate proteoglycan 4